MESIFVIDGRARIKYWISYFFNFNWIITGIFKFIHFFRLFFHTKWKMKCRKMKISQEIFLPKIFSSFSSFIFWLIIKEPDYMTKWMKMNEWNLWNKIFHSFLPINSEFFFSIHLKSLLSGRSTKIKPTTITTMCSIHWMLLLVSVTEMKIEKEMTSIENWVFVSVFFLFCFYSW